MARIGERNRPGKSDSAYRLEHLPT